MDPRVRRTANWVNLSTPAGLTLGRLSGARTRRTADGLFLATGYRWRLPIAGAFTVGDVVLTRARDGGTGPTGPLSADTWQHETRHSEQYASLAGFPFVVAYGAAAGWSYMLTGDWWSENVFEHQAGLEQGGYRRSPPRAWVRRLLG